MAVVWKEKVSKTPFGRELLEIRRRSETEVAAAQVGEANRIVLLSASAGATVAFGSYGAALLGEVFHEDTPFAPQADELYDPVVQFAYSLHSSDSMEAAYRVATWAMVGELGDFFWRSRYQLEIQECAKAFHFASDHEVMVTALAEPVEVTPDQQLGRRVTLEAGALVFMLAAALGVAVPWDDPFVAGSTPRWQRQFRAGLSVATERMRQLAPQGLPRGERPFAPSARWPGPARPS